MCATPSWSQQPVRATNVSSGNVVLKSRSRDEAFIEPIETIKVAAGESGIVAAVLPELGDTVKQGQLMIEMDQRVLQARLDVAAAKASSNARRVSAEVELKAKTDRFEKVEALLRNDAGSPGEVEKARSEMEVARQTVAQIENEIEQFQLEVKQIEAEIELRKIRSPIDGVVVDVRHQPGEYISVSDPHIVTIVRLETLQAVFYLPTSAAKKMNAGDTVELLLTETGATAAAMIRYVAPITNADSGRVRVDVEIDNAEGTLRSGVRCVIVPGSNRTSMMSHPSLK